MNPVKFGSTDAIVARMPSPKIWADCPVLQFQADPAKGIYFWDDFIHGKSVAAAADGGESPWFADVDTGCSIAVLNSEIGAIVLTHDGGDNDMVGINTGDNVAGFVITPLKGERKKFWFEMRFKVGTVTDDDIALFAGFAAPALNSATSLMDATTVEMVDVDYVGFFINDGDGNDLTIVHNEATSGTAQSDTGEITLVADTYVRVGFRLDVSEDKLRVYLNGVDQGDDAAIDITSANFPSNTKMAIYFVTQMCGGAAADIITLDWIRFAQEY